MDGQHAMTFGRPELPHDEEERCKSDDGGEIHLKKLKAVTRRGARIPGRRRRCSKPTRQRLYTIPRTLWIGIKYPRGDDRFLYLGHFGFSTAMYKQWISTAFNILYCGAVHRCRTKLLDRFGSDRLGFCPGKMEAYSSREQLSPGLSRSPKLEPGLVVLSRVKSTY